MSKLSKKHPLVAQAHLETPDEFKSDLQAAVDKALKSGAPRDGVGIVLMDFAQAQLGQSDDGPSDAEIADILGIDPKELHRAAAE